MAWHKANLCSGTISNSNIHKYPQSVLITRNKESDCPILILIKMLNDELN